MASSCCKSSPIIAIFVGFLLVSVRPVSSAAGGRFPANQTLQPGEELQKLKWIKAHLRKINKPPVKTIQSPDGDLIDCVLSHQQPAFDHPLLKGQKPMDPPERPKGHNPSRFEPVGFQLWRISGEECPEGTIPIRRTSENDVLRASSVSRFGRKNRRSAVRAVRRDSTSNGHEHAVGYVTGDQYYGAKASLNVWGPHVSNPNEFSLSQLWVISGSFGDDLNTIEAGWQVSPELYGDNYPRFFTYWTTDAYQATGCYNLLCTGFVQTNNKIAIGAAISPTSTYEGGQFDISLLVWKIWAVERLPALRECVISFVPSQIPRFIQYRGWKGWRYNKIYVNFKSEATILIKNLKPTLREWETDVIRLLHDSFQVIETQEMSDEGNENDDEGEGGSAESDEKGVQGEGSGWNIMKPSLLMDEFRVG